MNKKFIYGAFAFAALGLASCSNDEPNVAPDNNVDGESYMYVRLTSVGNSGTRAENTNLTDGDFEDGVGNENILEASNVRFYFFDKDGNPFTLSATDVNGNVSNTNMVEPLSLNTPNTTNGNIPVTSEGVLVLGKPTEPYVGTTPAQVVCVANVSNNKFVELANKTLTSMQDVVRLFNNATFTTFAMSSTTYASAGKEVFAADVTGSIIESKNFADQADAIAEAKKKPVNIYIERLAAKLRLTGLGDKTIQKADATAANGYSDATYTFVKSDQTTETKTLKVTLTGWQVRNEYTLCKIIKDLGTPADLDSKYPGFNWNAEAYHRSFWAITPSSTDNLQAKAFDIYNAKLGDVDQFVLGNYDDTKKTENIKYVYPNTAWPEIAATNDAAGNYGKPLSNRVSNATAIVVRGVVHVDGEEAGLDMVKWNGEYHVMAEFKKLVQNMYNGQNGIDDDSKVTNLDDITLKQITGKNLYYAQVKGNDFARVTNVEWWKNGVTSYYINIQHDSFLKDGVETPLFGIVRNHIYDTDITNVIGLGVPGNEIENPEKDRETFLAARINVLNWKVVSNGVVLE